MRKYDINCRKYLEEIAIGHGIDVGCADNPMGDAIGVDIDNECAPDIIASMDDLPFPEGEFDFLVSSHCLEHHPDTIKVLKEWKRVLKNGGKIGIAVPHGEYVSCKSLGDTNGTHRQLFTPTTLGKYLLYVGFTHVKIRVVERPYAWKQSPGIVALGVK